MRTISLKLPGDLAQWLAQRSKKLGRSQSDLVREALLAQRRAGGKESCHDLMRHMCGIVKGPRDLSTNPKRLNGFGE